MLSAGQTAADPNARFRTEKAAPLYYYYYYSVCFGMQSHLCDIIRQHGSPWSVQPQRVLFLRWNGHAKTITNTYGTLLTQ